MPASCCTGCRRGHGRSTTTSRSSVVETMPSGGRLEMVTDATAIELEVQLTIIQLDDRHRAAGRVRPRGRRRARRRPGHTRTGTLIMIDWPRARWTSCPAGRRPCASRACPPGEKLVEVWLPQRGGGRPPRGAGRRHGRPAARRGLRRWVHYGSSISHCLEATRPTGVWPVVAARLAGVDLQSLGLAGQCQLDAFAARTIRDLPADLISCKLGINIVNGDTMRERTFVPAVHGFLDTIREGHPDVPLVLDHADLLPGRRGPSRARPVFDATGSAPSPSGRRRWPSARSPCGASASSTPRSSPPGGPRGTTTSTSSAASTSSGPTTSATSPTTSTRTRRLPAHGRALPRAGLRGRRPVPRLTPFVTSPGAGLRSAVRL